MRLVINRCYGGFSLSEYAAEVLGVDRSYAFQIARDNADLIALVESLGSVAVSGRYAKLVIVELPEGVTDWEINEYDGFESVTYVVNGKLDHC